MQFHILDENYTPVTVMDNELPDAINFNNSKFHRFLTGSADFFDFETSKLHVDHNQFQVGYWLAFKYDNRDRLQYINEISEAESDKMMTISSVSSNLDLNNETKEPFSATEAKPFKWYFDIIMFDTGYEIGINEISNLTRKLSWDSSMTVRAFIQSVATQFDNAELDYEVVLNSDFTIKKRLIHIKKKIGEVRDDIELRYGDNVKTVKRTTSISELCTAVRPVSKDDNDKVVDISSLNDWQELDENGNVKFFHKKGTNLIFAPQANDRFGNRGHNVTGGGYIVHDFSYDKVSQNELFNRSHIYLKEHSVPAINYEVDGRTGAKIGDTVKIVDDGYTPQLILSARVLEQVFSFDNASVERATFGNYKALQSQISADLIAKMQQLAEENAPYKAVTLTTNGLTFKNSEGSTTLTARLYKGSKEIVPESYEWTIDGGAISENSEQHEITADDINGKAVVRWSAVINGVTVAFDEVTITDVSDGANGVSPTVTVNPDTSLTIADAQGTSTTPVLKGTDGDDGLPGKDGTGIQTTTITYASSTSGTTAPTSGWTSAVPTVAAGSYLWTKTVWGYTDNTSETGYSVAKMGNNGATGPKGPQGLKGDPGATGIPGQAGADGKTSYIHIAYATNSTGTAGFDVSNATGKTYIGQYTDFTSADSTDPSKYTWSLIKGDKGDKGDPGIKGSDGTSGIIVSSVAPDSPQTGQLWQDTSTTPQLVKKWTGSSWVIWEFYAENLKADTISTISLNLGDMIGGTVKLMDDISVNGTLKKFGIYQSKLGLLSSGAALATTSTMSNSQMGVVSLNKGELRFIVTDYTENLKGVQDAGMSDQNHAFIKFDSYDNGKDVMSIGSSGDIVFKGITSQDTPWIAMLNGTYYKNMFSRVYISYSIQATSNANILLGVLPVGLRPFRGLHLTANAWGTTITNDRHIEVRTTGEVTLYNPANGASYDGEVSFTL